MVNRHVAHQGSSDSTNTVPTTDRATHLRGRRLVAARVLVFTLIAATLAEYVFALPDLVPLLALPCEDNLNCMITPENVAPLARLGLTPHALAVAAAILSYAAILLVCGVAAVLLWRRSDDWMALLVALTLILMPAVFTPVAQGLPTSLQWLGQIVGQVSFVSLYLLIGLFPSGRFVPRWLWVVILVDVIVEGFPLDMVVGSISSAAAPNLASDIAEVLGVLLGVFGALVIVFTYSCLIGGQIYRYRHASTPVQRQQTKWAVAGLILTVVVNQLYWQPAIWVPAFNAKDSLYPLLAGPDSFLMICILAVSFGVAILRYRLYDIDIIIRRTLIYGSLTVILVGVYVAGVVGVQSIVNAIARGSGNETSPVLVVITTLVIAALFQPLRRRVQRFIDRRFYRRKYDSRKTVEAFSATLRQQVDLATLTGQLVTVVDETMQPEHVSLWLRESGREQ